MPAEKLPRRTASDFPLNLRLARIRRRLAQIDLADACNVNPSTISLYETGRRAPTPELLEKICTALACSPAELGVRREGDRK